MIFLLTTQRAGVSTWNKAGRFLSLSVSGVSVLLLVCNAILLQACVCACVCMVLTQITINVK